MCLIVDINIAGKVFRGEDADFNPVHCELFSAKSSHVKLVYGGKLAAEYRASESLRRFIIALDQKGRALRVADEKVNAECEKIKLQGVCQSNDEHIIALARVSNVRLLCTDDRDLITDFGNKDLISQPRGKVYQKASHKSLITRLCKS